MGRRKARMIGWQERKLVYLGLFIACSVIALVAGPAAGLWSFVQVALMIELVSWLGSQRGQAASRRLF